jgi:predicted transcriptional regulator
VPHPFRFFLRKGWESTNSELLTQSEAAATLFRMEVQFTPEQEAKLAQIASVEGIAPARLVQDAALRLIEDDARFREAVRKGISQADEGLFIEEAEMDARVARMLNI